MKKYLLLCIVCLCVLKGFGQYNFYKLSAGVNLGTNMAFADLNKKKPAQTISGSLDYNFTPFLSAGLEIQNGTLKGGDSSLTVEPTGRYFKNNYTAFILSGKLQLGQVVDFESSNFLYAIRGLYSGIGFGIIQNKMKEINRVDVKSVNNTPFPGADKSNGFIIPINTGININITDRWGFTRYIFNVNYQFNLTTGEGLDGYNDSLRPNGKVFSKIPDMYGVLSAGIKVCFGPEGLY